MPSKSQLLAAAALADLQKALTGDQTPNHDGPAFKGSHNCLANIERDYARRNGGHWFDKDSMRFFGTRFPSGFRDVPEARVTLFLTTDKSPHDPRAASIRAYRWDAAQIGTLGEFNAHSLTVAGKAMDLLADMLKAA